MSSDASGRLKRNSTIFMLCDMQEKIRPVIFCFDEVVEVSRRLILGAKALSIPVVSTEQYPKGLGSLVPELKQEVDGYSTCCIEKTRFSMLVPEMEKHLTNVASAVLFGVETHVCIQQTALDLLALGKDVFIVADATSSRSNVDRKFALERMRQSGIFITTAESVLFELLRDKNDANFKVVQNIIKKLSPDTGL